MRIVFDIETNGLLDYSSIDYLASPFRIKATFRLWCVVTRDIDTGEVRRFVGDEIERDFIPFFHTASTVVGHNILDFDLLALKLLYPGKFEYQISYTTGVSSTINGRDVIIIDTLVLSKVLNPDRYGGHSLDEWGKRVGMEKIGWRKTAIELGLIEANAPKAAEFAVYHPKMLEYCERDTEVNVLTFHKLMEEMDDWDWADAVCLEHIVRDIVTRQSHRGFWFNKVLADANVRELDIKMEEIRAVVEPLLPPKPMGVTKLKNYMPPKIQFKKNGDVSEVMKKWCDRQGGIITSNVQRGYEFVDINGKAWKMPMDQETPIQTHEPATVKDTTHIKGWLVELGWKPTQYKERDLTCDAKKNKLSQEKFEAAVERYVEQTLASPFCKDRCDELDVSPQRLRTKLLQHSLKRPLKVYTNPTITVGMEKEIDPALLEMAEEFPHAKLVSEYLTYAHRRNSILGGGVDPDELDDPEDEFAGKGYMAAERISYDGRIPTPADSCGAGTSRFKHRLVANIPRVTSLYGKNMRGMFGVDREEGFVQLGYDFDSLEAKIEAHYVYKYPGGPEYGVSLTAQKPNDCHSVLARKITGLLGREFPRNPAKNVKYGCLPTDNTSILTPTGWVQGCDVGVGDTVLGYNSQTGKNEWTEVTATYLYEDAEVVKLGHKNWQMESTADHRWYGERLRQFGSRKTKVEKRWVPEILRTSEFVQTFNILNTAEATLNGNSILPCEAGLVAWLIADGYYKWSEKEEVTSASNGARKGITASIAQASHKFQTEVEQILDECGIKYAVDVLPSMNENTIKSYRLKSTDIREFMDRVVCCRKQKHDVDWVKWVLKLSKPAIESFLHHFWLADGDSKRNEGKGYLTIRQNYGNIADAVLVAGYLLGYNVTQRGGKKISTIRFQKERRHTTCQEFKETGRRLTQVFCLSTGLDTFVVKQGGVVTITGNCSYNAQPARVAKTVGCSLADGQIIFDAFWEQAAPLKELKERMQDYWSTTGQKKFLKGLDNRKLPIRSKGNVINTAFQSAGVICAKRAMVMHEQKLKAGGMFVDFFRDNWRAKDFCQQLIAYHDEAQLEVRRKMVTWKKFDNEVECKEWVSDDGKVWSDPVHTDKGWFRGYCRAGELATIAVREAGQYYKLNVELSAGYMLGTDWASCH